MHIGIGVASGCTLMAQERPNRFAEWVLLLRQNAPIARDQIKEWVAEVRSEPHLLWETTAIRFVAYGVIGLIATWGVVLFVSFLTPPPPEGARDAAVTADFRVVCADPSCGYNFVIKREFGFHDFPVTCDRCKQKTGMQGRRCYSALCEGRWVAPLKVEERLKCPMCGTFFVDPP
jgi:hypothetical protein